MAHELRNPLSVIKGFIQLSSFTGQLDKYYDTILSEIDRMNDILEIFFLSLSKKQTNKKDVVPEKMCDSLIPLIQSECLLKKILYRLYEFERSGALCFADISMVKQVILNLLRNAVEAFDGRQKKKRYLP
ncbi:histidine kinase dimerization/phospho-acceptor domain-containing protein [Terrilactibacillus sp. S3-3]|nr:histidine kinase dimerization/phospho-acceptor domain-containing protein [Terrilactibacillus sp. S3-3]